MYAVLCFGELKSMKLARLSTCTLYAIMKVLFVWHARKPFKIASSVDPRLKSSDPRMAVTHATAVLWVRSIETVQGFR